MFIAIEFEDEIKDYLDQLQTKVKENSKRGNFTQKENYHITLRFIGEVDKDDVALLADAVNDTAVRNKAFSMNINEIGCFPKGNTSIVWVGLNKSTELMRLFATLEKSLEKQGFSRDKKGYTPHITLGREVAVNGNPTNILSKINIDKKEVKVTKISLMESKRLGNRLVYNCLYSSSLK